MNFRAAKVYIEAIGWRDHHQLFLRPGLISDSRKTLFKFPDSARYPYICSRKNGTTFHRSKRLPQD